MLRNYQRKYKIEYDKSLVRGMGYYTRHIFEIVSPEFKGSIAGGGRYDKMIGNMIGEDVPAVGFSQVLKIAEILLNSDNKKFILDSRRLALLYDIEDPFVDVIEKADEIRERGYDVTTIVKAKKLGRQFAALEREGFDAALVYGETEIREFGD